MPEPVTQSPSVYGLTCQQGTVEGEDGWVCFDDCTTVYGAGFTQLTAVCDYLDNLATDAAWLAAMPLTGPLADEYPRILAQAKRCGLLDATNTPQSDETGRT